MVLDFLFPIFKEFGEEEAVVRAKHVHRYRDLENLLEQWREVLLDQGIGEGTVVSLEADFSADSIAALLALIERGCILVPLSPAVESRWDEYRKVAEVEAAVRVGGAIAIDRTGVRATHEHYAALRSRHHAGLVLFSSGSTGKAKAAVHDFVPLLAKFRPRRKRMRAMSFLLFDHIGGVNTLFYTLSNGGCVVVPTERTPDSVCAVIERQGVQLLPTSPTFLRLLLVSEAYRRYDLSSLEVVSYGTEVMPESTLQKLHRVLPDVYLQQTYGLSELGILRSKSKSSDSLLVKLGGEGFETRVVDGLLEIKAHSAMLGYLNAPSPFTEDGWFKTGDAVEVEGEYFRIRGRVSDLINVGGEKVYPAEVESLIDGMEGVEDCSVSGEANAILGQIVAVTVKLSTGESQAEFETRMWEHCRGRIERYKIPQRVRVTEADMHGGRFKKMRQAVR